MNTNVTTPAAAPAKTNDKPRIKSSKRPPACEAMPWYACASMVF